MMIIHISIVFFSGQYQCFAKNKWGTAKSNTVFIRKTYLNDFKQRYRIGLYAELGQPFGIDCEQPGGYPAPFITWAIMENRRGIGGPKSWKTINYAYNSSRLTVDPEGKLWFSNVTKLDAFNSTEYRYACAATTLYPLNEFKYGNILYLNITSVESLEGIDNAIEPVEQVNI